MKYGENGFGYANLKEEFMSRVGKQPVEILEGVSTQIKGNSISIKGPKGELQFTLPHSKLQIMKKDGNIFVTRQSDSKKVRSLHGLSRTIIKNMVIGVKEGYSKKLVIEGVGFKAQVKGKELVLYLGFSHPVKYSIPENITIEVQGSREILVSGIDKAKVGEVAAEIRNFYKPEPYKGKGIRYEKEKIRRKAGKTIA